MPNQSMEGVFVVASCIAVGLRTLVVPLWCSLFGVTLLALLVLSRSVSAWCILSWLVVDCDITTADGVLRLSLTLFMLTCEVIVHGSVIAHLSLCGALCVNGMALLNDCAENTNARLTLVSYLQCWYRQRA